MEALEALNEKPMFLREVQLSHQMNMPLLERAPLPAPQLTEAQKRTNECVAYISIMEELPRAVIRYTRDGVDTVMSAIKFEEKEKSWLYIILPRYERYKVIEVKEKKGLGLLER